MRGPIRKLAVSQPRSAMAVSDHFVGINNMVRCHCEKCKASSNEVYFRVVAKWTAFYVEHKRIKPERITRRIK